MYIDAISAFIDVPLVKILAGVRRCGKSTIFEMIQNNLVGRGVNPNNIITRKYNEVAYDVNFIATDMFADLQAATRGKGRCYLFLDELQEIDGWEKVVNNLLESADVDIYVTGSNSKLMSSEISTYLSGRYVIIPVYTLSFAEYLTFKGTPSAQVRRAFTEYLQFGGFPLIGASNFAQQTAYQVVDGIYSAVITRDITKRHDIRNQDLFDRVVKFIVDNVGKNFSANSIVNFLKSERRSLTVENVYNYIKWLEQAFIIYPCYRYDLQGKSVLKTQEKYYLSDISFKYARQGFNPTFVSAMLENIVFLEMKRRGFDVYVGKIGSNEIDFVAKRQDEVVYVQVCRNLPDTSSRETDNLLKINDHHHKYVVTMDELAMGNVNGVQLVHIADFLLQPKW